MESIFRELKQAYRLVSLEKSDTLYQNLASESQGIRKKRKDALDCLVNFIDSGVWCKGTKNKDEFLMYYKLPMKQYAQRTGKSLTNVRIITKRMSDRLRDYIGFNCVNRILTCKVSELPDIMYDISLVTNPMSLNDFLIEPLQPFMKSSCDKEFDLGDLKNEIMFLRLYSCLFNSKLKDGLDAEKMGYLMKILTGKSDEEFSKVALIMKEINDGSKMNLLINLFSSFSPKADVNDTIVRLDRKLTKTIEKHNISAEVSG